MELDLSPHAETLLSYFIPPHTHLPPFMLCWRTAPLGIFGPGLAFLFLFRCTAIAVVARFPDDEDEEALQAYRYCTLLIVCNITTAVPCYLIMCEGPAGATQPNPKGRWGQAGTQG